MIPKLYVISLAFSANLLCQVVCLLSSTGRMHVCQMGPIAKVSFALLLIQQFYHKLQATLPKKKKKSLICVFLYFV